MSYLEVTHEHFQVVLHIPKPSTAASTAILGRDDLFFLEKLSVRNSRAWIHNGTKIFRTFHLDRCVCAKISVFSILGSKS